MNSLKMHIAFYVAVAGLILVPIADWLGWL